MYKMSFKCFGQVFFAVTMGSMILGQTAGTCFEALFSARGAAFVVFETIDQVSFLKIGNSGLTGKIDVLGGVKEKFLDRVCLWISVINNDLFLISS